MGLKRGAGHRCLGSRWRVWRPRRQILLSGKPHQHSSLRCNYYQRGRGGRKEGRKGPGCSGGLSAHRVLTAALIPENFCKPENLRAAWPRAAFYTEVRWKRVIIFIPIHPSVYMKCHDSYLLLTSLNVLWFSY